MGDVVGLFDTVQKAVDIDKQKELEAKLAAGEFTLDDFKGQLKQILQPGLMMKMMCLLPGMGRANRQKRARIFWASVISGLVFSMIVAIVLSLVNRRGPPLFGGE